MATLTLKDGYSRNKHPEERTFRPMTPDEARNAGWGTGEIYFTPNFTTYRRLRPNGAPKTWKRDPGRVELPVKYGMREYARAVSDSHRFDDGSFHGILQPVMRLPNGGILLIEIA